MQLLADGLLLVSFYRTASQLSLIDLAEAMSTEDGSKSGKMKHMNLPSGVIPFQTQADVGINTQKLVLFETAGVLCQKQSNSDKVVYSLKRYAKDTRVGADGCEIV
jgi:hypothetical protein